MKWHIVGLMLGGMFGLAAPLNGQDAVKSTDPAVAEIDVLTRQLLKSAELDRERCTAELKLKPDNVDLYSRRGDANFILGDFAAAVVDYDRMAELDPALDESHWRRGIAYFYAGRFPDAAGQFERYHSFDDVDRENGIWRYLSQVKSLGRDKAREGLLKYKKDDREPFPAVYQLFAGQTTPDAILQGIQRAELSAEQRQQRLFYAELYIGLNEAVEDRPESALAHLRIAAANHWAARAGYGPRYMWHVARLHATQLQAASATGK